MSDADKTKRFAQGLRNLMAREQISIRELSEWTGLGITTIRSYRSGRTYPQGCKQERLEDAFRMSMDEIEATAQTDPVQRRRIPRMSSDEKQLGAWFSAGVRSKLAIKGISMSELARAISVKPETLISWLQYSTTPKVTSALLIAEALETTIEILVDDGRKEVEKRESKWTKV